MDSVKNYLDKASAIDPYSEQLADRMSSYYRLQKNVKDAINAQRGFKYWNDPVKNYVAGSVYVMARNWQKADSVLSESSESDDIDGGLAAIRMGRKSEGEKFLKSSINRRLDHLKTGDFKWDYYDISRAYAVLGDMRYLDYFQKALDQGWHEAAWFVNDPFFDDVRQTPEFKKLKEKFFSQNEKYKKDALKVFSLDH
jgi:hypothetical protein